MFDSRIPLTFMKKFSIIVNKMHKDRRQSTGYRICYPLNALRYLRYAIRDTRYATLDTGCSIRYPLHAIRYTVCWRLCHL